MEIGTVRFIKWAVHGFVSSAAARDRLLLTEDIDVIWHFLLNISAYLDIQKSQTQTPILTITLCMINMLSNV